MRTSLPARADASQERPRPPWRGGMDGGIPGRRSPATAVASAGSAPRTGRGLADRSAAGGLSGQAPARGLLRLTAVLRRVHHSPPHLARWRGRSGTVRRRPGRRGRLDWRDAGLLRGGCPAVRNRRCPCRGRHRPRGFLHAAKRTCRGVSRHRLGGSLRGGRLRSVSVWRHLGGLARRRRKGRLARLALDRAGLACRTRCGQSFRLLPLRRSWAV